MFVANTAPPPSVTEGPRWYWHRYNRVVAYRLAAALERLPRRWRLALARRVGALAVARMPAERAAVRATLATITGASGARLDVLTRRVFEDFAACFSDLVTTNRRPAERLLDYVARVSESPILGETTGVVSVTAHVGNWEMAGRLLAGRTRRRTQRSSPATASGATGRVSASWRGDPSGLASSWWLHSGAVRW